MREPETYSATASRSQSMSQRDVGLPKRNCDAGFVEGIEDGDPQIRARAAGFVEVVNERAELEIETVCAEFLEIDGRCRHRHDVGIVLRDLEQIALAWRGSQP